MANRNGWWELKVSNNEDDEEIELSEHDREHIAEMIKKGNIMGEIVRDD